MTRALNNHQSAALPTAARAVETSSVPQSARRPSNISTEFKVVTDGSPNELWASGFYGEHGRAKAQRMVDEGYWHRFMYAKDKHKTLIVVEAR